MKKQRKRIITYAVAAFLATVLAGTVILFGYTMWNKASGKDMAREALAVLDEETEDATPKVGVADEKSEQNQPGPDLAETEKSEETEMSEEMAEIEELTGQAVLAFGGDICFHDPFANMQSLAQRGGAIESCISEELLAEMRNADICMVNNEFPYSDRGTPIPEKTFAFRSKPENVALLGSMGVDIVSLANNHAYDHGETAFLDTLEILENAGVKYVGAGRNLAEASAAQVFEVNGVKIGILAATQIERLDTPDTKGATENSAGVLRCFSQSELEQFLSVVEETKKECDVLIVYIHWGTENTDELDWAQPYQADLISKAGADLIVGAHPHCLQGIDSVNGVLVVYSLGNYWFNSKALDTALLKVTVGVDGVKSVQLLPARQENCATSLLRDGDKQRVLTYLQSLSANVVMDEEGYITW